MIQRRHIVAFLLLFSSLIIPGVLQADRATDIVFSTGVLDSIPQGKHVTYRHQRLGPSDNNFHSVKDGLITLGVFPDESGGEEAILEMRDGGKLQNRTPFPADAGNPLVMAFLESSLRSMAQITGGSPFYLRNRIKEALRSGGSIEPVTVTVDGETLTAEKVVFIPFRNDKNAAKMGDFAGLELSFVVSDAVPGGFVQMSAQTPEAKGKRLYQEIMRYSALSDQE
ncbi:MAG TPA: hypothetical protein ENJ91_01970 [Rhodobacteraceae bacterium]|nr:hypothetical protein [Paracoccaceae bacterium]